MIRPRCPDPEVLARLLERRIGRAARSHLLDHAADCVNCRRHLAIGILPRLNPWNRLQPWAALVIVAVLLAALCSGHSDPEPAPTTRRVRRVEAPLSASAAVREEPSPAAALPPPEARRSPIPSRIEEAPPLPELPPRIEEAPLRSPPKETVALPGVPEAPPPAPEPPPVAAERYGRLAILDPFGTLALEGVKGSGTILASMVVATDARIFSSGGPSGFRLADGTRLQLAAGGAVSVFQNLSRGCSGLTLYQGSLLVEPPPRQSLFVSRGSSSGQVEVDSGVVQLSAGGKDGMILLCLGPGGAWSPSGAPKVEMGAGETLQVQGGESLRRKGSAKASLARYAAWPEPRTLFFNGFEEEGHRSALAASKRKRIEIPVAAPAPSSGELVLRIRFRTTASRIECSFGNRSAIATVPQRNRSESVWATLSVTLPPSDGDRDGSRGGERGGRRGSKNLLTLTVDPPARGTLDELVFDVDEVELRRPAP